MLSTIGCFREMRNVIHLKYNNEKKLLIHAFQKRKQFYDLLVGNKIKVYDRKLFFFSNIE